MMREILIVLLIFVVVVVGVIAVEQYWAAEASTLRSFTPADRANQILERQNGILKRQVKVLERIAVAVERMTPPRRYAGQE